MGLFDPPPVKELKKEVALIGGLLGQLHLGYPYQLSRSDVYELIQDEGQRAKLRDTFAAAAAAVGDKKALKAALRSANVSAESYARLNKDRPYGDVPRQAEATIRDMLGR
jgi:hypothetical protein